MIRRIEYSRFATARRNIDSRIFHVPREMFAVVNALLSVLNDSYEARANDNVGECFSACEARKFASPCNAFDLYPELSLDVKYTRLKLNLSANLKGRLNVN